MRYISINVYYRNATYRALGMERSAEKTRRELLSSHLTSLVAPLTKAPAQSRADLEVETDSGTFDKQRFES